MTTPAAGLTISGLDLSWTGISTPTGYGISIQNNVSSCTLDGITVGNRTYGFYAWGTGITNLQLTNSMFHGNTNGIFVSDVDGFLMYGNMIQGPGVGLGLFSVMNSVIYHNNICSSIGAGVIGNHASELWNHTTKEGNYWCLTCNDDGFVPGVTSNRLDIRDDYAYGAQDGWLLPTTNPGAYPCNTHTPEVDAGPDQIITLGYGSQSATLTAVASSGTPPYTYLWSTSETTHSITVSPLATTTYTVTVTDAASKTGSDDVSVTVLDWRCGIDNSKITICHNDHTICVSPNALQAHLDHGDYVGPCTIPKSGASAASKGYVLDQNHPNPFSSGSFGNPSTVITYTIPGESRVLLRVFDVFAREVATLVNADKQEGTHQVVFDATGLPSGTYIYKLEADGISLVRAMNLLK